MVARTLVMARSDEGRILSRVADERGEVKFVRRGGFRE